MQTILIIDDDIHIRRMLRLMLEMSEFQVIEAEDGLEGLETAVNHQPDLIISDVMMPNLDGFALCQQLRQQPLTQNIPILMMSGDATTREMEMRYNACAEHFLRKPFQFDQLLFQIKRTMKAAVPAY